VGKKASAKKQKVAEAAPSPKKKANAAAEAALRKKANAAAEGNRASSLRLNTANGKVCAWKAVRGQCMHPPVGLQSPYCERHGCEGFGCVNGCATGQEFCDECNAGALQKQANAAAKAALQKKANAAAKAALQKKADAAAKAALQTKANAAAKAKKEKDDAALKKQLQLDADMKKSWPGKVSKFLVIVAVLGGVGYGGFNVLGYAANTKAPANIDKYITHLEEGQEHMCIMTLDDGVTATSSFGTNSGSVLGDDLNSCTLTVRDAHPVKGSAIINGKECAGNNIKLSLSGACNAFEPDFDHAGLQCANDGQATEAHCTYLNNGDFACAYCHNHAASSATGNNAPAHDAIDTASDSGKYFVNVVHLGQEQMCSMTLKPNDRPPPQDRFVTPSDDADDDDATCKLIVDGPSSVPCDDAMFAGMSVETRTICSFGDFVFPSLPPRHGGFMDPVVTVSDGESLDTLKECVPVPKYVADENVLRKCTSKVDAEGCAAEDGFCEYQCRLPSLANKTLKIDKLVKLHTSGARPFEATSLIHSTEVIKATEDAAELKFPCIFAYGARYIYFFTEFEHASVIGSTIAGVKPACV
jgi:hypothetical protein